MAERPLQKCCGAGCRELVRASYCEACRAAYEQRHTPEQKARWRRKADQERPEGYHKRYGRRWTNASRAYRASNPLCVLCMAQGKLVGADCVDHILPAADYPEKFWQQANWQSLCNACHASKTLQEKRLKRQGA